MGNTEKLNKDFVKARVERNEVAKALFSTFKGEYENALKKGDPEGDDTLAKIAKKMIKNAELVGTDDAKKEIEILKEYVPAELSEDEIRAIAKRVIASSSDKLAEYKGGKKGLVGFFVGSVMKESKNTADPNKVKNIMTEELEIA